MDFREHVARTIAQTAAMNDYETVAKDLESAAYSQKLQVYLEMKQRVMDYFHKLPPVDPSPTEQLPAPSDLPTSR